MAQLEDVEIRTYEIIYKLLEESSRPWSACSSPSSRRSSPRARGAGDLPVRGSVRWRLHGAERHHHRVPRSLPAGGTIIWKGDVSSLRRFKEDVGGAAGFECGIGLSDFQDLKQGTSSRPSTSRDPAG